ncbi:hypothetical protein ACLOJK_040571, partial [Asimina triloba]
VGHALLDRGWTWEWKGVAAFARWDVVRATMVDLKNGVLPIYCHRSLGIVDGLGKMIGGDGFSGLDSQSGDVGSARHGQMEEVALPVRSLMEELASRSWGGISCCSYRRWSRQRWKRRLRLKWILVALIAINLLTSSDLSSMSRRWQFLLIVVPWICKQTLLEELTAGSHGCQPLMKVMEHHNRCSGSALNSGALVV